jgi:pyridoxine 5-phosphate synthase
MPYLSVNIDHFATIRQARQASEPDPVEAARIAEAAGAIGITAHLREDRRHVQDLDVQRLRKSVKGKFNLEMAATDEMIRIAKRLGPDEATLVPERRQELTTEGGLEVAGRLKPMGKAVDSLKKSGILVSLFITPDENQVWAAAAVGAPVVEFHTGAYAHAKDKDRELKRLRHAAAVAQDLGLIVNLGHGLTTANVGAVAAIEDIEDLNIGHHIVSRASLVGLRQAVKEMLQAMKKGSRRK